MVHFPLPFLWEGQADRRYDHSQKILSVVDGLSGLSTATKLMSIKALLGGLVKKDKCFCVRCHDNFYNGNNDMGIKECWRFNRAKVVSRYRIAWWTAPDSKERFTKVTTLDCHKETGQYEFCETLPKHLVGK